MDGLFKSMKYENIFDEYVKVCDVCESLILDKFNLCPYCKSYRFTYNMSRVKKCIAQLRKKLKEEQSD